MRVPVLVISALFLLPAAAQAGELRTQTRELVPGTQSSLTRKAPSHFNLVGVSSLGPGSVSFRTRSAAGRWSGWRAAVPEAEDLPDGPHRWTLGNPYWTGPATAIRYRLRGRVERLRTTFVWSVADAVPLRRFSIAGTPTLVPRRAWAGSDTALRRDSPRYADAERFAVVHHTAGASPSSPAQSISIVRAIAAYHVYSNGWDDIGYNFLVDRFGQVFEGRYGGIDRNVIGAHAQGFNTGSVGVALIGTYSSATPTVAARDALARIIAWRLDIAHVDPLSTLTYLSGGNPKYPAGAPVFLRAVSGHRDTGFTSCPGDRVYGLLPSVAQATAASGLPKLYSPQVQGKAGGPVRFQARLSGPLSWRVTVADAAGGIVASGTGAGSAVDWTWDATQAPLGKYAWTIRAGSALRPATGMIAAGASALTITASALPATVSPDGDGRADTALVHYRLGRTATVTLTVLDSLGAVVATLPQGQQAAGAHTLSWAADAYADGGYTLVLTAQAGVAQVVANVPVAVNRTLSQLAVTPAVFSPNGDGRLDTLSYAFTLTSPADVTVDATRPGSPPILVGLLSLAVGQNAFTWNGSDPEGVPAPDGTYTFSVRATNAVGTVAETSPVTLDTTRPRLQRISLAPLRVRVSEATVLQLTLDGRRVTLRAKRAGVLRLRLSAKRITAYAEDAAGNRSPVLRLR
jgi:N-acetylmuramoyl-L-alanine amidase-like protein/flagellar hook capping protein FlgD